ncbi:hypothetical protein BLNAU_11200 [Blattamonas nauphoetae]|uniref:Uncharacterized protein n=1 Tax=Blattamonas nauphoetae TaxID=2049346 RepID=A0ABQ9XN16_9EUKA|nr:hypothetical protein BLNAU_11200 [Blattamonas nauphoetae]
MVVVFRSLVATLKLQPVLDGTLEEKAVKLLKSVVRKNTESADAFLHNFGRNIDDSSPDFVHSIVVLISSPSQDIATPAVKMLTDLINWCSAKGRYTLVQADLLPQLIAALNPLSLSFAETGNIHVHLLKILQESLWFATPDSLILLGIENDNEKQAVHETILKQVLLPSEKYIRHLCVNSYSIIDGEQSRLFLILLARLLRLYPSSQPTMEIILHLPVFLAKPNCLTFFENESSIWNFLIEMNHTQLEWNRKRGELRKMGNTGDRMLRMEGIEDVIEEKLQNDKNTYFGVYFIDNSIKWNNLLGMNIPYLGDSL